MSFFRNKKKKKDKALDGYAILADRYDTLPQIKYQLDFTVFIAPDSPKAFIPYDPLERTMEDIKDCNQELAFFSTSIEIYPNDVKFQERVSDIKQIFFKDVFVGIQISILDFNLELREYYKIPNGYYITRAFCTETKKTI
jgi:hypothetical protein